MISTALLPRTDRNVYVVWMAIIWAAMLGGFGLDFMRYMHETPPPPIILHIHAAVYVIWLILVSVQIFLVQTGDIRLHMRLGWATAIVSAAMVPLGLVAALVDQARQVGHPDYAPQFLALEFEEMFAFSTVDDPLCSGDFRCRFRPDMADGNQSHLPGHVRLVASVLLGHYPDVDCHAGLGLVQAQARHALGCLGGGPVVGRRGRSNDPQFQSCMEIVNGRTGQDVGTHWLSPREANFQSS
jgi:hypothetical protein